MIRLGKTILLSAMFILVSGGCKSSLEDIDPSPIKSSDLACAADSDCLISCYKGEHCCGDPCECSVLRNRASQDALRAWRDESCKNFECPQADCDIPQYDYAPYCDNGLCQVDKTPWVRPEDR